jgi:hypothetical protein
MPSLESDGTGWVLGQKYGAISIDLGKSYPLYGVRMYHKNNTSSGAYNTRVKRIQIWYSTGELDTTDYQNRTGEDVNYYRATFMMGDFTLEGKEGYRYFYFNRGFNSSGIENFDKKLFNSQIYARYLHVKIIEVYSDSKQLTSIPRMDFILPGTKGTSNYLFNNDVYTFNNSSSIRKGLHWRCFN